jgi:hypothetical protein
MLVEGFVADDDLTTVAVLPGKPLGWGKIVRLGALADEVLLRSTVFCFSTRTGLINT